MAVTANPALQALYDQAETAEAALIRAEMACADIIERMDLVEAEIEAGIVVDSDIYSEVAAEYRHAISVARRSEAIAGENKRHAEALIDIERGE